MTKVFSTGQIEAAAMDLTPEFEFPEDIDCLANGQASGLHSEYSLGSRTEEVVCGVDLMPDGASWEATKAAIDENAAACRARQLHFYRVVAGRLSRLQQRRTV